MSIPSNQKTTDHLMHLIMNRNGNVPNFSLLLGSGASHTSGVPTAQDMIERWRRLLYGRSKSADAYSAWVSKQSWHDHEDEYSMLFEELYDQPSQRRIYIEECVKNAHPSWGYVYLTNLLSSRFFDVVLTTNFDDLLNEACYLYSDGLRPIVAAHDSAVQGIRVTSGRPKIIKLHGDYLYDNIRNTLAELETLETNIKRKLNQFAQEYGLVVLGYSGRDRSVMDTLELLLRSDENYKQGVYWCIRRNVTPSNSLQSLLRKDRVYLVEIDGFDEFAADLHRATQLRLPKPIARPFEMAKDRARLFTDIDPTLNSHAVIGSHVREVLGSISTHSPQIPSSIHAEILSSMGKTEDAVLAWKQAYDEDPDDSNTAHSYASSLAVAGRIEELADFVHESPIPNSNKTYFLLRAGQDQEVIDLANKALDEPLNTEDKWDDDSRAIVRINRAIAMKRLRRTDEMQKDLSILEENGDIADINIKAGVAALRGDRDAMFAALRKSLYETISPKQLKEFPVFEDYRNDPEFLGLLGSEDEDNPGQVHSN